MELPTMGATQAVIRALELARQLAGEIHHVNMKSPAAVLDQEFQDLILQVYTGALPGPTPDEAIPIFERLFLTHIASRYVIVPDQP